MTVEQYRAAPGINYSRLKQILKSPAHYKADKGVEETIEMRLGSYADAYVIENRVVECVIKPSHAPGAPDDKWHGAKKWCKDWIARQKPGVEVFSEEEYERAIGMVKSLQNDPLVQAVLALCPERQKPVFAQYRGRKIKCLLDLAGRDEDGRRMIWDLKTTGDVSDEAFSKKAASMHYDMQLEMYKAALATSEDLEQPPLAGWIVQENVSPYTVRVVSAPIEAQISGLSKLDWCLEMFAKCEAANDWPGFGRMPGEKPLIKELPWPGWANKELPQL